MYAQKQKIGTYLGELDWVDAILQETPCCPAEKPLLSCRKNASLRMDIGTYVYGASDGMTLVRGKSRGTFCNPLCAPAIIVPRVATRRTLRRTAWR